MRSGKDKRAATRKARPGNAAKKQRRDAMKADLARSGLVASDAKGAGITTMPGELAKTKIGMGKSRMPLPNCTGIYYSDIEGNRIPDFLRVRAHSEYQIRDPKTGIYKPGPKYWQPQGMPPRIYYPMTVNWHEVTGLIIIVEGEKKALALCKAGFPAVAIGGVWNWKSADDHGLIRDFDGLLEVTDNVAVCFDSDVATNPSVRTALCRFCAALMEAGFEVEVIQLPGDSDKIGADDFLVQAGKRGDGSIDWKRAAKAFNRLPRTGPPEPDEIVATLAATVETEPLQPVAPYLYRKKITIFVGDPGLGKSMVSCDATARVTTGEDWPGGVRAFDGPSNVVMLTGEDDFGDTVVPRLMAAGADLGRVILLNDSVTTEKGQSEAIALDRHMEKIHKKMVDYRASLLVIDPVSAFMGRADSHRNSSVRAFLGVIRRFAKKGNYAVLLITHFSKPGERRSFASYRVMGSIGFSAAPRAVYGFIQDPDDPDKRLMLPIKSNLGDDKTGYRFRISTDDSLGIRPPPPFVDWYDDPVSDRQIDDLLDPPTPREAAKLEKEAEIREWLSTLLLPGEEMLSQDFNDSVADQGFDPKRVRQISKELGYRKTQHKKHGPHWTYRMDGKDES